MKHTLTRGLIPVCLTLLAISFGLLIASCNDSAVSEIELPEQSSLDTPESYLKAIAKAQTNLFSHASSAMREMDEEEFEKVMRNAEKVLERSPVYKHYSQAEGDFEVRKFSEEEYRLQTEQYESDRQDFLDALSPIISPEIYGEIQSLITEFVTVHGGAEVDTTGWREILHRASQDALAQETGSLSCSSPQQITVSQASILPMPSIATIMGWFGGSGIQQSAPCGSCCIECCKCTEGCVQSGASRFGSQFVWAFAGGAGCSASTWWFTGGLGIGGCSFGALVYLDIALTYELWRLSNCKSDCRASPQCTKCPKAWVQYEWGLSCDNAPNW